MPGEGGETRANRNSRVVPGSWRRRALRIATWGAVGIVVLVLLAATLLYVPFVQDRIRGAAKGYLADRIGTRVELQGLHLRFPLGVSIEGLLVEDQAADTLLRISELKARLSVLDLLHERIALTGVVLHGVHAELRQDADSVFNFDFIVRAFASDSTAQDPVDTAGGWAFSLDGIALRDVSYTMDLAPARSQVSVRVQQLELGLDDFDLERMRFHADRVSIEGADIAMRAPPTEPSPDIYPDLVSPLADIDVGLERANLKDIFFRMSTVGTDDSLWVLLREGELAMESMDSRRMRAHASRIALTGLDFGLVTSDTSSAPPTTSDPPWLDQDDGFRYFVRDLDLRIDELRLKESAFAMHRSHVAPPAEPFDARHLVFEELAVSITHLQASNDSITVDLREASAHMGPSAGSLRCKARISATPERLRIDEAHMGWGELSIALNAAAEQGSLSHAYREPQSIPVAVEAVARIEKGSLEKFRAWLPEELAGLKQLPEALELNMRAQGRLAALDDLLVDLKGDAGSVLHLTGRVENMLDADRLRYDARIVPLVMGPAMSAWAHAFLPPDALFPQRLQVEAELAGDRDRIDAALSVRSDLADIDGPVNLTGLRKEIPDQARVDLRITHIALAKLTGDTTWGDADLRLQVEADALSSSLQRQGWLQLTSTRLTYADQVADSLRVRADVLRDSIQVVAHMSSEPLALSMEGQGTWPDANDSLKVALMLRIAHADLHALGVVDHALSVAGDWHGYAAFDTTGHGSAALRMDSTRLQSGSKRFVFEELAARAHLTADSVAVIVASDAIDAGLQANIGLDTLMARAMQKGRDLFTSDTGRVATAGERLDLAVDLKRTEWLTGMLLPRLQSIELEQLEAHYDGDADELSAAIVLPHLMYDSVQVRAAELRVRTSGAELSSTLSIGESTWDAYALRGLRLDASGSGGELQTKLRITEDETDRYRIGATLGQERGWRVLRLDPDLLLDGRTWSVDSGNVLRFGEERVEAERLSLRSGDESIAVSATGNDIYIDLQDFRITTIADIISTRDSLPLAEGRIDGTVRVAQSGPSSLDADLTVNDLHAMGTELGTLKVDMASAGPEQIAGKARLTHTSNRLDASWKGGPQRAEADADLDLRDIAFLKPFVSDYLYELSGGVSGHVHYLDQGGTTTADGRVRFKQARAGVVLTGATYTIGDETLELSSQGLRFDDFALSDSVGNAFHLDGRIRTTGLADPRLDLRIRTDRFQLINSSIAQNPRFYGDLFAGLDVRMEGPVERPRLSGDLGILPGTAFSVVLPGSTVELVSSEGIVVFTDDLWARDTLALDGDAEALRDSLAAHLPGVELDLRVRVDKEARFAIVLDPAAGDQATVSGAADLEFRYAPDAPMFLSGAFTVEEGEYELDLYGLVKKRFNLAKGGTVRWSGDPVKAEMDLQARYVSETAPYALVATSGTIADSERNRLQQPLPFVVLINIDGSMNDPDIGFGLELERQLRNSFPKVGSRLDQLNAQGNDEELNRQVFGLLVLNSFIQEEGSGGAPSSGIATSAARNSVNGLLTDQMNKLTGRYLKGVDISLGVNTYDQATGNATYQRTSVDYKVSKRLLDDRLSFEVGGSVGVDEQDAQVSNVSNTRAAQYAILYDLTPDGRFRIRGFHENAYDLYDGEITNSGVAVMFTRDFEENERARSRNRDAARERRAAEEERIRQRRAKDETEEEP